MARHGDGGASGEESRSQEPLGTPKTFESTKQVKDRPKAAQDKHPLRLTDWSHPKHKRQRQGGTIKTAFSSCRVKSGA